MSTIPVTYQNASGVASNVNADGSLKAGSASVSQDEFLSLLVTQLKNQDPTSPTDQTQMLAQLAQFSSLSEMQGINKALTAQSGLNQIAQTAALIGKTVTGSDAAGNSVSGAVTSVSVQNGTASLQIGSHSISASTVTQIQ